MKTIRIEGAIRGMKWKWEKDFELHFTSNPDPESKHYLNSKDPVYFYVAPYTIEIEVDESVFANMQKAELKSLQRHRKLILAENQKRLDEIDNRISNILAIENKEKAA